MVDGQRGARVEHAVLGHRRKTVLDVHVDGGPTAVVFNSGRGFVERGGGRSDPARFIYACEDGIVRAWTPTVPTGWSTRAVPVFSGAPAAIFRGLALLGSRLYATDFHNGTVVVLDSQWQQVAAWSRRVHRSGDPGVVRAVRDRRRSAATSSSRTRGARR